ncbi:YncE family protein [Actinoallomurus purpureus]|uniref:YncE family protein n=1 Tax=Actinoallomurus purpureus TaxID=478114 RepID=UPI002092570B|nr:YncE family protein [Actinoallomurus purpureus]MCO6003989.1 YncE family protein [Actinoallomurus purpureus]
MPGRRFRALMICAATAAALSVPVSQAGAAGLRDVLLVGNSQSGSVSFIDGRTYQNLGSFNVIGDLQQRLDEMDPIQRAGYETVKQIEGGDRFVDDVQLSPDGRALYVSRGNIDDAAAFDLVSGRQLWHTRLDGFHADHAALSPDGGKYVISATTAQVAEVLDTATGAVLGKFGTGTYPHQNDYTADGKYIYNSSIGVTSLPQALEGLKGTFQLTKVDASTLKVVKTWLFPHGVRPNLIAPDGNTFYAQQSYLNGFIKYDLAQSKIVATVTMPYSAHGKALKPDDYPQNSAHHGLALSGDGAKLCDVGTIDDYTAIVNTSDLSTRGIFNYPTDSLPYWGTSSVDGNRCFVSLSKANAVSVIDYATATEVARIPVGVFPQRERIGQAAPEAIAALTG